MYVKLFGIIGIYFEVIGKILIRYLAFNTGEECSNSMTVNLLFIDIQKAFSLVTRKVSYHILIVFGVSIKMEGLIKMCVYEICRKACTDKQLSDLLLLPNVFK